MQLLKRQCNDQQHVIVRCSAACWYLAEVVNWQKWWAYIVLHCRVSLVADNLLLIAQDNASLDLSVYRENDLWQITSTAVVNNTRVGSSNLQFIMYIRRMPFYYIMNIAIPILVLSLLSVTVFWLPPNSGEKVSLSVTVFLSFTVFSVLIVSNLPVSSDSYPLLGELLASRNS